MKQETLTRLGAAGRRVPGLRLILDVRAERIRRRVEQDAGEGRLTWRNRTARHLEEAVNRGDLRINVGAGPEPVEGWKNVDLSPDPELHTLYMDATEPWPLLDGSVEAVNSEHFLEHLDPAKVPFYFREAYRVLRPGGLIRTSTPDLEGLMRVYLERDKKAFETHLSHGYEARTYADMVNNYIYSWGHRHIYDFETLASLLGDAGFEQIERVEFGLSRHPILDGVDAHDVGALHRTVVGVDAVKPA